MKEKGGLEKDLKERLNNIGGRISLVAGRSGMKEWNKVKRENKFLNSLSSNKEKKNVVQDEFKEECPIDPSHLVPKERVKSHLETCLGKTLGLDAKWKEFESPKRHYEKNPNFISFQISDQIFFFLQECIKSFQENLEKDELQNKIDEIVANHGKRQQLLHRQKCVRNVLSIFEQRKQSMVRKLEEIKENSIVEFDAEKQFPPSNHIYLEWVYGWEKIPVSWCIQRWDSDFKEEYLLETASKSFGQQLCAAKFVENLKDEKDLFSVSKKVPYFLQDSLFEFWKDACVQIATILGVGSKPSLTLETILSTFVDFQVDNFFEALCHYFTPTKELEARIYEENRIKAKAIRQMMPFFRSPKEQISLEKSTPNFGNVKEKGRKRKASSQENRTRYSVLRKAINKNTCNMIERRFASEKEHLLPPHLKNDEGLSLFQEKHPRMKISFEKSTK